MRPGTINACLNIMLGAVGLGFACVPWLMWVERFGGNERLIHLLQTFVAMPVAFVAGALFLWFGRSSEDGRAWRPFAWVVVVASGLWLAFLAYVLWCADFSWMDQK
jgi:hypothetical protein